jgi:phage major head subunit gpT-like protein
LALFDIQGSKIPAKIGKTSGNAYNHKGWLVLPDFLNEWIAEGVISDVKSFEYLPISTPY